MLGISHVYIISTITYREGTFVVGEAAGLAGLLYNPRGTVLLNSIMH